MYPGPVRLATCQRARALGPFAARHGCSPRELAYQRFKRATSLVFLRNFQGALPITSHMQVMVSSQASSGRLASSDTIGCGVTRPHMCDVTTVNIAICLGRDGGIAAAQGSVRS